MPFIRIYKVRPYVKNQEWKNLQKNPFKLVRLSKIEPYTISKEHTNNEFKKICQTRMK